MPRDVSPLLVVGDSGLYCPAGDFHVDHPWRPVPHALITHGHGDHLRSGNGRYWLAAPGLGIARSRMGAEATIEAVLYREPLRFGQTTVSWHPAGHVLGSAQLRIEHEGRVWVVSGDYKRDPDPTCEPFEPLPCDVFISEATFALPVYRWPPAAQVVGDIYAWRQENRQRGHWWKWKIDPWSFDAVLLYAQPGSRRRSSLYYTFGAWRGDELVPVAKAYSGLQDAEIAELDRWIRAHTRERFGPVPAVEATQVFEIAFEGIAASPRHKSGVAQRFPRILRWRRDKPAREADTLETLQGLLHSTQRRVS